MLTFVEVPSDYQGDFMVIMRCNGGTLRGARCRNRSGWDAQSILGDPWYCHLHRDFQ